MGEGERLGASLMAGTAFLVPELPAVLEVVEIPEEVETPVRQGLREIREIRETLVVRELLRLQ